MARRRHPPLALAAALPATAALAAGGCDDPAGDTFVDCAGRFAWRGQEYFGTGGFHDPPPTGAALSPKGRTYFCDDAHPTTAYRIQGVDPLLALRDGPGARPTIWLAEGSFPQRPDHPLHHALFGTENQPYRAGDHHRCTFHGHVTHARFDLSATDASGPARIIIDARTHITGAPEHAGQPFLLPGTPLSISARRCRPADRHFPRQMTAVRIRVG
jgi:hypothetical protein